MQLKECATSVASAKNFNPYFLGTLIATLSTGGAVQADTEISILIFLERSLQPGGNMAKTIPGTTFQSLFSWNAHCNAVVAKDD